MDLKEKKQKDTVNNRMRSYVISNKEKGAASSMHGWDYKCRYFSVKTWKEKDRTEHLGVDSKINLLKTTLDKLDVDGIRRSVANACNTVMNIWCSRNANDMKGWSRLVNSKGLGRSGRYIFETTRPTFICDWGNNRNLSVKTIDIKVESWTAHFWTQLACITASATADILSSIRVSAMLLFYSMQIWLQKMCDFLEKLNLL